jgi:hypothetical protein
MEGVSCRDQGVDHRLVADLSLPAHLHAVDRPVEGGRPVLWLELALAHGRGAHLQEKRSIQWAAGAANAGHERHAGGLEQAADVVPLQALQLGEDRFHPTIHVDAVVGVPDRGIELREVLPVLGHGRAELLDPAHDLGIRNSHPHSLHRTTCPT